MKTTRIIAALALAIAISAWAVGCTYHEHYYMGKPVSKTYVQ
ncbi:MAG: hypothetical protein RBU23_03235 [Candidatus Auribacterota bacterium]|jgi:hypothetical protein|nr:hypothetical protein [Candidatus Auribacterota bacterium]